MNKLADFYDNLYKGNRNAFAGGPIDLVTKITELLRGGRVLDIGSGSGRNAFFLAKEGFKVTAVDFSQVGLEKLKQKALDAGLQIETKLADITESSLVTEDYDVVLISFVLHHLPRVTALSLVRNWQKRAKSGSFHAISTFTSEGDFYRLAKNKDFFYPAPGELLELYKDWEIIFSEEKVGQALAKNEQGEQMKNLTTHLIARKK